MTHLDTWLTKVQKLAAERATLIERLGLVESELGALMPGVGDELAALMPEKAPAVPAPLPAPTSAPAVSPVAVQARKEKAPAPEPARKSQTRPPITRPCSSCAKAYTTSAYGVRFCEACRAQGVKGKRQPAPSPAARQEADPAPPLRVVPDPPRSEGRADLTSCPMCMRRHRGPDTYCSPACREQAKVPAGTNPWDTKAKPYTKERK